MMLHTKWNGQDKYSYSSHVSYTGTLEYKSGHQYWKQTSFSDLGYCCRIFPTVELSEPRMVRTLYNETGEWVLPEYSKKSKNYLRPVHLLKKYFFQEEKFWELYKARRSDTKNGIENGLMLLMDVESFENAQYPRWAWFAFSWHSHVWLIPSKAEGLIVALSGDLERPLVGQSGTFVEAGSANLISIQVDTFLMLWLAFYLVATFLQPS